MKEIKRVAIIGLGAMGASYAHRISKNLPDIELFGVVRDVETFWGSPIMINGSALKINYRTVETLKQIPLDLIMICVKSYELEEALADAREIAGPKTLLMGFSCGIDAVDTMIKYANEKQVIPCVAVGSDISRTGRYVAINTRGKIVFGAPSNLTQNHTQEIVHAIDKFLREANLRHEYTPDIKIQMWRQFMFDVAIGQTAAVYQMTYGELAKNEKAFETISAALEEIRKIANKCGVAINDGDIIFCINSIKSYSSNARSVMLQDYWMDRRLETEVLCDKVVQLAQENNVRITTNAWLYDEIHKLVIKGNIKPVDGTQSVILTTRTGINLCSDNIANQIRMEILKGKYPAGAKLKETELAQQFDASRNSVRTAMQLLSDEGLLKTLPNGRREIISFGEKEIIDLFDFRMLIETCACETLLNRDDINFDALDLAMDEIKEKYKYQSQRDWNELDVMFHTALVDAADNVFLSNSYRKYCTLWHTITGFSHPKRREASYPAHFYGDHQKLYKLIKKKDAAVLNIVKAHVISGKEEALLISGFKSYNK